MTLTEWFAREGLADASLEVKAERLKIPATTLWRIFKAKDREPSVKTVKKIARRTGGAVRFEDLVGAS